YAGRNAGRYHLEEGVVRDGIEHRAGRRARRDSRRDVLPRLAGITHSSGQARRSRNSRLGPRRTGVEQSQRSEVGDQKSEVRSQKSEVRGQRDKKKSKEQTRPQDHKTTDNRRTGQSAARRSKRQNYKEF